LSKALLPHLQLAVAVLLVVQQTVVMVDQVVTAYLQP
jgi:hypothetical protein